MKKYFLLIIVAGNLFAGCQRVEEANSSTSNTNPSIVETAAENTNTTDEKNDTAFKAEVDSSEFANVKTPQKQVEKVELPSKPKPSKKKSKTKKTKKKIIC